MPDLTPQQQILLKEYEICAADASGQATRGWQATAVFTVLVVGAFGFILQSGLLFNGSADFSLFVIAIIVIVISITWTLTLAAHYWSYDIAMYRMAEIESSLGMRRYLYEFVADRIYSNNPAINTWIKELRSSSCTEINNLHGFIESIKKRRKPFFLTMRDFMEYPAYQCVMCIGLIGIVGSFFVIIIEFIDFLSAWKVIVS